MRRTSFARSRSLLLAAGLALSAVGCTFEHAAQVDPDFMLTTHPSGAQIKGYVHAECWTPTLFYVFPIMPGQSAEKAKRIAFEKAKTMGANGIGDVRVDVQSHTWFFFIFCWTESHVSATALSN